MTNMTANWDKDLKSAIAGLCHCLYDHNYLVATSGNVSARTGKGFLITPSGTRKDAMTQKLIVECDAYGRPSKTADKPSSETSIHREVYKARPDVGAVIHAHPHYCLACSLADISLTEMLLPELAVYVGPVPSVPYATPGTDEMAKAISPYLSGHNAFLLKRHGVLVLGQDLQDAYNRMEHLEHVAHIAYLVSSMGTIEPLTKTELRKLSSHARKLGQHISHTLLDLLE